MRDFNMNWDFAGLIDENGESDRTAADFADAEPFDEAEVDSYIEDQAFDD